MARVPKISVVTPSFNQCSFIEEALNSVKDQAYPNVEHIVVDGSSSDDTVHLLTHYSSKPGWEHLRWISEPDEGQSDALNKGFRIATGDFIGWLNSDDRYRRGCFQKVAEAFCRAPDVDVLYGDYCSITDTGEMSQIRREIEFNRFVLFYHRVLYIPTTSTFFRRRVFDDGNWIDTTYQYAMDYDFFLRLADSGYRFQHLDGLLADFRWHPSSKSSRAAACQFQERDWILLRHSHKIRQLPFAWMQRALLSSFRLAAITLRVTEKLVRGYYFPSARASQST
jgi:glycosyltransferase involved in cell wall biosynthesis